MGHPVILDAARTPFGKRGGALSGVHAAVLLASAQRAVVDRSGLPAEQVEQVIGGCVTQAGEQSASVVRNAWLHAQLPQVAGATTIDSQCSSAQQSLHLVAALVAADVVRAGMACGVESMSRVPLLSNITEETGFPRPDYLSFTAPDQFTAADRIAVRRGFSRRDLDEFGLRSQERARAAWREGRMSRQVVPLDVPACDGGPAVRLVEDEGLRETSVEALAQLRPVLSEGMHTAGTSSQISDGASAAVVVDEALARAHGLTPRGRVVSQCLIGSDGHFLLDGPIDAAERVMRAAGMTVADIDVFEVNEAFASVPMSFAAVLDVDHDRLNVNGGAIAVGHPVGATGLRLVANALDELERRDGSTALVAVCAGGALASAAIIERL